MCCLFAILFLLGPRLALLIWWLVKPLYFQTIFNNWILPLIGIIFLPWTTLIYLIVASGGVTAFDLFLLIFAFIIDIGSYSGSIYGNRDSISRNN